MDAPQLGQPQQSYATGNMEVFAHGEKEGASRLTGSEMFGGARRVSGKHERYILSLLDDTSGYHSSAWQALGPLATMRPVPPHAPDWSLLMMVPWIWVVAYLAYKCRFFRKEGGKRSGKTS